MKSEEHGETYALQEGLYHTVATAQPNRIDPKTITGSVQDLGSGMAPPSQERRRWIIFVWITEILMIEAALLSLVGIYSVLTKYNNSPLPKFPYSVTINTIVSLLTQVFTTTVGAAIGALIGQCKWNWFSPTKSGSDRLQRLSDYVVFEEAAQGPVGAVKLLLTRPTMIIGSGASLGALLVLTLPIVGSFAQQLVKYEVRSLPYANTTYNPAAGVPTVPSSSLYNAYMTGSILAEKTTALGWKGGFSNVVYNIGTSADFDITASCPTGNCTWPDYASLGVSSACVNRTSEVVVKCDKTGQRCDYSMKYGSGPTGSFAYRYGTYINGSVDTDTSGAAAILNETSSFGNEISRITYLFTEEGGAPRAVTCSLYLAVHTRRTAVANGMLMDNIISTFPNASVNHALDKIKTNNMAGNAYNNISITPSVEDGSVFAPGRAGAPSYNIIDFSWTTMKYYTETALTASASGGTNEISYDNDLSRVLYNLDHGMDLNNKPMTLSGEKGASVGYFYQKLANSLTVVLRSDQASSGSTVQNGTSYTSETYVKADWKWLALPGVVLFLAFILLAFVMWQTSHHGVDPFKGAALPGLFINVAPAHPIAPVASPTGSSEVLSEVADQIHVKLSRGPDGRLMFTS